MRASPTETAIVLCYLVPYPIGIPLLAALKIFAGSDAGMRIDHSSITDKR
jgi:hypothetical protein